MAERRISARATISAVISQASPFHPTSIKLEMKELKREYGSYKIHELFVPTRDPYKCDSIGSVYDVRDQTNPTGLPKEPARFTQIHSNYAVGDLSTRHDGLSAFDEIETTYHDFNLPLLGKNSVIGRSLAFYHANGQIISCHNLTRADDVQRVYTATLSDRTHNVTFLFRQDGADEHAPTTVSVRSVVHDVFAGNKSIERGVESRQHEYGVHLFSSNDCDRVGGHFRDVVSPCSNGEQRCEIGALSKKFRALDFNSTLQYG